MRRSVLMGTLFLMGCPKEDTGKSEDDSAVQSANAAPVITIDSPQNGGSAVLGEPVEFSGFMADDKDSAQSLKLFLQTSVDGADPIPLDELPTVNSDGIFSGQITQLPEGKNLITFTATDADGAVGTGVDGSGSTVTVIVSKPGEENQPPSKPLVHIEPTLPVTGESLQVVVDQEPVDPEGAAVVTRYRWLLNNDTTTSYSAGPSLDGSLVHKGDTWHVEVWGNDGKDDGEIATDVVTSVTVGNAAPTDIVVTIDPSSPTGSTTLTCTAVVTDPDDSQSLFSFLYQWTVNGVPVSGTAATLAAGTAVYGDVVGCELTATDPDNGSIQGSASVTIGNELPSSPTIGLSPANPTDTDALTCTILVDAVEPDHQAFTYSYAWDADGVPILDAFGAPWALDVLPAELTHRDQTIRCLVTATDEVGGAGIPAEASAVIARAWTGVDTAGLASATIDGLGSSGLFGKNVALVGDVDLDGYSEVMVGASGEDSGDGTVYLFSGAKVTGHIDTGVATASWNGPYSRGSLGGYRSFDAPGDMDGDGSSELLFAAADSNANGETSGIAWLIYGGGAWGMNGDPRSDADWYVAGSTNDHLGTRLSSADVDGDGVMDVLVSATGASDNGRKSGTVAVFLANGTPLGGATSLSQADWKVTGDNLDDELGWTLKSVGDINLDGYDDFLTTSFYAQNEAGIMGLFFGSLNPSGTLSVSQADAVYTGAANGDRFGYDAVGAFDYDQDGATDLMVGAYLEDTVGTEAGVAYVFQGFGSGKWGSFTPQDAKFAIYGAGTGDRFGHMIVSPGDMDSDGTDDLVLGALLAEPTGALDQGAAYLLLSPDIAGISNLNSASMIPYEAYGEAAGDYFGDALAVGRGDVNGDGILDFAVGAQRHDAGANDAGRVYFWWGR